MSSIVILAADPIFGAVLQDRLRVDGHTVEILTERIALERVAAEDLDLAIIEAERDMMSSCLELLTTVRGLEDWHTVPALVLAPSPDVADRVAALKAGADDYLTKPCDLEEVVLRASRLVERPRSVESVLQGDLANFPVWELMQFLHNADKTGELRLRSKEGDGRMSVSVGQVIAARWGKLAGREAMIGLCGLTTGSFEFVSREVTLAGVGPVAQVHEALMRAAWLRDQLAKHEEGVPRTSAVLKCVGPLPDLENLEMSTVDLPLEETMEWIAAGSEVRLFDVLRHIARPPNAIRLAVAILIEEGALEVATDEDAGIVSTADLTSSLLLETAVTDVLGVARSVGFGTSALPFAIVADGAAWSKLVSLVADAGAYQGTSLERFAEDLREHGGASVTLPCDLGKLVLHLIHLAPDNVERAEAVVATCAGVLLWTNSLDDRETLTSVVARAEAMREPVSGLVIVPQDKVQVATELIAGTARWRLTSHEPYSFLGFFGLLRPRPQG